MEVEFQAVAYETVEGITKGSMQIHSGGLQNYVFSVLEAVIQADAAMQKLVNADATVVSASTIGCSIQAVVVSAVILKNQYF